MDLLLLNATPFVLALLLAWSPLRRWWGREVRTVVTTSVMLVLFMALLGYVPVIDALAPTAGAVQQRIEWLPELGVALSFYADGLALFFGMIVTGIGAGVCLYTGYYFDDDADGLRFTIWLMAFAGAMLGVVLSGNLITLFVMWELTSITSFMLIGFYGKTDASARWGALQALLITGGGALALILAFGLLGAVTGAADGGTFNFEIARILDLDPIVAHPYYNVIAFFLMLGAFTKSAQFPFHFWLPNAMSAPTPASSYLHSATMVKAGIFLLLRLYPVMQGGQAWTIGLVLIGTLTMLIGAFFALGKDDLKGVLAYLTVSTLGAIVALIGLPAYEGIKAAIVMILAHAFYKAALFLSVGTIEHDTGTRKISALGGLRQYMPVFAGVVAISALSMMGIIPLVGSVGKEVFLDAFLHWEAGISMPVTAILVFSAMLTVTAGAILIWDVFMVPAHQTIHYHASSSVLRITPVFLAAGSVVFGLLIGLGITVVPLVQQITPKEVYLDLFPPGGLSNTAFQLSIGAIVIGLLLFAVRDRWLWITRPALPSGTTFFRGFMMLLDWVGDQVVKTQNGQIRYYLVVIFAALAALMLSGDLLRDLLVNAIPAPRAFDPRDVMRAILLVLSCACAVYTVVTRNHLTAALALGLLGYFIGGIFLIEPAPDVALVQFLVETLATILIVVMLGRISPRQRQAVMAKLWKGRSRFDDTNLGIFRDLAVAGAVGVVVTVFTLTALLNRPQSAVNAVSLCSVPLASGLVDTSQAGLSITIYHMCNAQRDLGFPDMVGAIVTDYRGMDTLIEISVFTASALGVLTLLSRGFNVPSPLGVRRGKAYSELDRAVLVEIRDATSLSTPFTRFVSRLFLLLGFMVALAHLNYGGSGPGDGFTAGALLGLVTALWYVVFGYQEARERLAVFAPHRLIRIGLLLVMGNALLPLFLGQDFMSHVDYDRLLGLYDLFDTFGLHLTSTLVYETSILLVVFGSFSSIIEAIAHPQESAELDAATLEDAH